MAHFTQIDDQMAQEISGGIKTSFNKQQNRTNIINIDRTDTTNSGTGNGNVITININRNSPPV